MTQKIKKMSLIMVNIKKILKQINSLSSGINIKFLLRLACLVGVVGLISAHGAVFPTVVGVVGIYLGYRILRLVMWFAGLIISCALKLISIIILITIISLLIF